MGFALPPGSQQHDGPGVAGASRIDGLEEVERRVGDLEELAAGTSSAGDFDVFVKSTVVPLRRLPRNSSLNRRSSILALALCDSTDRLFSTFRTDVELRAARVSLTHRAITL